jgi:transcriptional regulator with XRE-family HTH domain
MPSKKVSKMTSDSLLCHVTFRLLRQLPRTVTYADLAKASGVSEAWIKSFGQGRMTNPSVVRVEKLYNALSDKPLELPHDL